jgi:molybdopterin-binding protein
MPHMRIAEVATALGVSDDTVRRWIGAGLLAARRGERGRQVVDGLAAARLAQERARPATDPSPVGRSARNRFVGLVTEVHHDAVMGRIEMQCGDSRIEAVMSAEAVHDLRLEPGSLAVSVVKATDVIIEPLRPGVRPQSAVLPRYEH